MAQKCINVVPGVNAFLRCLASNEAIDRSTNGHICSCSTVGLVIFREGRKGQLNTEVMWKGHACNIPFTLARMRFTLHKVAHELIHERIEELHKVRFPESSGFSSVKTSEDDAGAK